MFFCSAWSHALHAWWLHAIREPLEAAGGNAAPWKGILKRQLVPFGSRGRVLVWIGQQEGVIAITLLGPADCRIVCT